MPITPKPINITVDLTRPGIVNTQKEMTYGDKNLLTVTVTDGGAEIDLSTIGAVTTDLVVKRLGTTAVDVEGSIVDGKAVFTLDGASLSVPGYTEAAVQFYDAEGGRISTARFSFRSVSDLSLNAVGDSTEQTIIQRVLFDAPTIIDEAEQKIVTMDEKIVEVDSVIAENTQEFLSPVNAFSDLETTYPTPSNGNKVYLKSTGETVRFNGTEWIVTNENDPSAIGYVTAQLDDKASKQELLETVGNISEGTPLFASSVAGMTDITRNYVNMTDGFLYTHNGTTFVSTGVLYQATGINNESVGYESLDEILTENKIYNQLSNVYLNASFVSFPTFKRPIVVAVGDEVSVSYKIKGKNFAKSRIFLHNETNANIISDTEVTVDDGFVNRNTSGTAATSATNVKLIIAHTFKDASIRDLIIYDIVISVNGTAYSFDDYWNDFNVNAERIHPYVRQLTDYYNLNQPARVEQVKSLDNRVSVLEDSIEIVEEKSWLAFGDSITLADNINAGGGYVKLLNDTNKYDITNRGVGGMSTLGLWELVQGLNTTHPFDPATIVNYDIITIMIGTNYAFGGISVDESVLTGDYMTYPLNHRYAFYKTIEFILERKRENAHLVLLTPPKHVKASQIGDQTEIYEGNMHGATFYSIPIIDVNRKCQISKVTADKYLYDELHPNLLGYEKIAHVIDKGIVNII